MHEKSLITQGAVFRGTCNKDLEVIGLKMWQIAD